MQNDLRRTRVDTGSSSSRKCIEVLLHGSPDTGRMLERRKRGEIAVIDRWCSVNESRGECGVKITVHGPGWKDVGGEVKSHVCCVLQVHQQARVTP